MEAIQDTPFYDHAKLGGACLPFVVAAHERWQDRLIIGPFAFAENQTELFDWLYRDFASTSRLPAFRLGTTLDLVVAARIYPIDLEETISHRRDGVVVVGLAARKGSPAVLCDHLGFVVRQIARIVASEAYPLPGESEAQIMLSLGQAVADSSKAFDWATRALLALNLCAEIPHSPTFSTRRLWSARKPPIFAALIDGNVSTPLQFRVASEFWRRSHQTDITVAFDDHRGAPGASRLLYHMGSEAHSPLTILDGRDIQIGKTKVRAFTGSSSFRAK